MSKPDDDELEDFLAGRGSLHAAWLESAQQTPPAALDAAVLAQAQAAVVPLVRRSRSARWRLPLSLAASLVLSLGLLQRLGEQPEVKKAMAPARDESGPVSDQLASAVVVMAPATTDEPALETSPAPVAKSKAALPMAIMPPPQRQAAGAAVAVAEPVPAPAAAPPPAELAADRQPPAVAESRSAALADAVPPPEPAAKTAMAPRAAEAQARARAAPEMSGASRSSSASAALAAAVEQDAGNSESAFAGRYLNAAGVVLVLNPDEPQRYAISLRLPASAGGAERLLQASVRFEKGRAQIRAAATAEPPCDLRLIGLPGELLIEAECTTPFAGRYLRSDRQTAPGR